jgi:hypothetical protein
MSDFNRCAASPAVAARNKDKESKKNTKSILSYLPGFRASVAAGGTEEPKNTNEARETMAEDKKPNEEETTYQEEENTYEVAQAQDGHEEEAGINKDKRNATVEDKTSVEDETSEEEESIHEEDDTKEEQNTSNDSENETNKTETASKKKSDRPQRNKTDTTGKKKVHFEEASIFLRNIVTR